MQPPTTQVFSPLYWHLPRLTYWNLDILVRIWNTMCRWQIYHSKHSILPIPRIYPSNSLLWIRLMAESGMWVQRGLLASNRTYHLLIDHVSNIVQSTGLWGGKQAVWWRRNDRQLLWEHCKNWISIHCTCYGFFQGKYCTVGNLDWRSGYKATGSSSLEHSTNHSRQY
jgi:hypothetical protein